MPGKTCEICGKQSGIYPLCPNCFKLRDEGKIIKDKKTNKWILNENPKKCLLCENTTNSILCNIHYEKMLKLKEKLFSMTYEDLDKYYYNLDSHIYKYRFSNQYRLNALKLIAIAQVIKEKFNENKYIEKVYKRIEYLNEYKNKENETKNNTNNDEKKQINKKAEEKERRELEKLIYATDNHKVRSQQEQLIDNLLYNMRLVHCYERELPFAEEEDKKYCDWFIPIKSNIQGIYIEYWGYDDKEDYLKNKKRKEELYQKENLPFIFINKEETLNEDRLNVRLMREINKIAKERFGINKFVEN